MTLIKDAVRLKRLVKESTLEPYDKDALRDELYTVILNGMERHFLSVYDNKEVVSENPNDSEILWALGCTTKPTGYPKGLHFDLGRTDAADYDIDVEDERRHEIKEYITRKFKHVASIATFSYFSEKGVIRDAARVIAVPLADVNKVLKTIDTYDEYLSSPDTVWFRAKYPEVTKIANYLRGRLRGTGMHAAGIIVADKPLSNYSPIETRKDTSNDVSGRIPVVAYDMAEVESIGLIKIDLLGLKTLSVINNALKAIKDRHGVDIDMNAIETNDTRVFEMLSNGFTQAVFQAETAAFTGLLVRMGVSNFEDIVAANALVRPGAMNVFGDDFVARKQGRGSIPKIHPIYDEITKDTYGNCLMQEQIMLTCVELAGMTWGDANKVRRIIGKKKDMVEFEAYRQKFVDGASVHINKELAEKLWHDFEQAAAYLFNRSHSVAYSLLTYWTAWLKINYPLEFMYAALRDTDRRTEYLIESKRMGLKVLLPHVNRSQESVSIYNDSILLGLSDIKYISDKLAKRLINQRPFDSYGQLSGISKTKHSGISSRVLDSLNKIGAALFVDNPLRGDEQDYYYEYLGIPVFNGDSITDTIRKSLSNVNDFDEYGQFVFYAMVKAIKRGSGWSRVEIVDSSGSAAVFHNENTQIEEGRMYLFLVSNNSIVRYIADDDIDNPSDPFIRYLNVDSINIPDDKHVVIAFNARKTKAGKMMATVTLSNRHKELVSALVFHKNYPKALGRLRPGTIVDVSMGKLEDGTKFIKEIR